MSGQFGNKKKMEDKEPAHKRMRWLVRKASQKKRDKKEREAAGNGATGCSVETFQINITLEH